MKLAAEKLDIRKISSNKTFIIYFYEKENRSHWRSWKLLGNIFSPCPPNSDALFIPSIFGEMDKLVRYHASKLYKIVQNPNSLYTR